MIPLTISQNSLKLMQPLVWWGAAGPRPLHSILTLAASHMLTCISPPALLHLQSSLPMTIHLTSSHNLTKMTLPLNGCSNAGWQPTNWWIKVPTQKPQAPQLESLPLPSHLLTQMIQPPPLTASCTLASHFWLTHCPAGSPNWMILQHAGQSQYSTTCHPAATHARG